MSYKSSCFLFASAWLVSAAGGVCGSNPIGPTRKFVQAHHIRGYTRAAYPSPDGLYIARISFEDGEVKDEVTLVTISQRGFKSSLVTFSGIEGFGWVPHRQHTFVVSTDGGHNGTGELAFWKAGKNPGILLRGKDLEDDNFDIKQISTDGKKIIYEHFGYGVDEKPPEHDCKRQQLTLPSL